MCVCVWLAWAPAVTAVVRIEAWRRQQPRPTEGRDGGWGVVTAWLRSPTSPDHTAIKPGGEERTCVSVYVCVCMREVCGSHSALKRVAQTTSSVSVATPTDPLLAPCVYL